VRLKSVDISAKYGLDYSFALVSSWNKETLEKPEEAQMNTNELGYAKSILELNADQQNNAVQTIDGAEQQVFQEQNASPEQKPQPKLQVLETQQAQNATQALPKNINKNSLAGISAVQNGTYQEQPSKVMDSVHKQQLSAAYKKSYENMPGAYVDLEFKPGDLAKSIRINIVQDDISEDDEQVLSALLNAKGADVTENPTGYLNIKDDDEIDPHAQTDFDFEAPSVEVSRDSRICKGCGCAAPKLVQIPNSGCIFSI
jgi:hypothetical protein